MLATRSRWPLTFWMQLEDHLGDILRKARQALNVSAESGARAGGLDPQLYDRLEQSGDVPKGTALAPLATLVGLDAGKLQKIAGGWLPPKVDLSQWREIRVITTTEEGITVNCYVVWDEISREAALFDTGWGAQPILDLINAESLDLK